MNIFELIKSVKRKENFTCKTNQSELEKLNFYFGNLMLRGVTLILEIKYEEDNLKDIIVTDDRGYIILSLNSGTVDYDFFMQGIGLQKSPDISELD